MKKSVLFVAVFLFMAVPVMAAESTVTLSSVVDENSVTVSYVTGPNLVRAFGLDIKITSGDATITKVEVLDPNYRIYPGQIVIVDGAVSDYNTPYAPGDLDDNKVTVEMGTLYAETDEDFQTPPANNGELLKFWVECGDVQSHFEITENALRGGVVMEDADEDPTVNLAAADGNICEPICTVPDINGMTPAQADVDIANANLNTGNVSRTTDCTAAQEGKVVGQNPAAGTVVECESLVDYTVCECYSDMPTAQYNIWVAAGKPLCWCYPRQCKGDADGTTDLGKSNYFVATPDLNILKSAWLIANGPVGAPGRCADFDHTTDLGKSNYFVATPDLNILKSNWLIPNGPAKVCSPGNRGN